MRCVAPSACRVIGTVFLCGLLLPACKRTANAPANALPDVVTVTVAPQSVLLTTELPGHTAPHLIAEIRPQVSGLIQHRRFVEGTEVQAGQILYEIDPAPFQAALSNAVATLELARKSADRARAALAAGLAGNAKQQALVAFARTNRQRYDDLLKDHAVAARDRDQAVSDADVAEAGLQEAEAQVQSDREAVAEAEAAIRQAQAAMETARINLDYTRITAPIAGRIGKSAVTEGAIVTAYQQTPLAVIQQLDPIYVDVPQSTVELLRLRRRLEEGRMSREASDENKVRLVLADDTAYPSEGTLQFRDVSVDPTTGSVILRMVFPNPHGLLLPGMFVRARIKEGVNPQAIIVPQQTVFHDPKGQAVAWVVTPTQTVEQRLLTLDRAIGDRWLVSSGLQAGDRVITEGLQRVRPGMSVNIVGTDAAPAAAALRQPADKAN